MKIIGTKIWMTRGDSETITVGLFDALGVSIPFSAGDVVQFTVRDKETMTLQISKTITTFIGGKAIIYINPTDTADLNFKTYIYDVQYTSGGGTVTTLVKPSDFTIELEVSYE